MRTLIVLNALMAACSDEPGPHDVVDCGAGWGGLVGREAETCERACETAPPVETKPCAAAENGACHVLAVYEGVEGCCVPDEEDATIVRWLECN